MIARQGLKKHTVLYTKFKCEATLAMRNIKVHTFEIVFYKILDNGTPLLIRYIKEYFYGGRACTMFIFVICSNILGMNFSNKISDILAYFFLFFLYNHSLMECLKN